MTEPIEDVFVLREEMTQRNVFLGMPVLEEGASEAPGVNP